MSSRLLQGGPRGRVGVSDQGSDQGLVFLVMELVRGRTLRDLLTYARPKAANLAGLTQAGLPTPGGFSLGTRHPTCSPKSTSAPGRSPDAASEPQAKTSIATNGAPTRDFNIRLIFMCLTLGFSGRGNRFAAANAWAT